MPDMSIRGFSDEEYAALKAVAEASGMRLEPWAKQLLLAATRQPLVRERYAYRFFGPGDVHGLIQRHSDHPNGIGGSFGGDAAHGEQYSAYLQAQQLIRRNEPGDQQKAYDLLKAHFEEVFEVPV